MKTFLRDRRGFTLIEAMISAGILAVGILMTLQMANVAEVSRMTSKDITVANNLARQTLEDIKNVGYVNTINKMISAPRPDLTFVVGGVNETSFKYAGATTVAGALPGSVTVQQVVTSYYENVPVKNFTIRVKVDEGVPKSKMATVVVKVSWLPTKGSSKTHDVSFTMYAPMS